MNTEYFNMDQGSADWLAVRCGAVTASRFKDVLARDRSGKGYGKTRMTYLYTIAGEILTGQPADHFSNSDMLRGQVMEEEARDYYALRTGNDFERIGFARATIGGVHVGASPDALIGDDGLLEIKTRAPHLQLAVYADGVVPDEHIAQVQGQLWITGRAWCDYLSYWPGLPPLLVRVKRDDAYIATLAAEVEQFALDVSNLVAGLRREMGVAA
jgi:predicted phage-related endonuclease